MLCPGGEERVRPCFSGGKRSKPRRKIGEGLGRLPASALPDGQARLALAVAVDDHERNLLELRAADPLPDRLRRLPHVDPEAAKDGLYGDGVQGTARLVPTAVAAGGTTFTSVSLGQQHVCAVATGGAMYCWGNNASGQLGEGTNTSRTAPTALGDGRVYGSVTVGDAHSCGLTVANAAFCWGAGGSGQLGQGSTASLAVPTAVAGGLTFFALSAASNSTCGMATGFVANCWGANASSQLGDGTATQRLAPTAVLGGISFASIRLRNLTSCGRIAGGLPFCWGANALGSVGDGSLTLRQTPVTVIWVEGTAGVAVSAIR